MLTNAFIGKVEKPTERELAAALGSSKNVWDRLVSELADEAADIQEWKSYSPKQGWSLRLKRGKRTIIYLSPCEGCFRIAFILGDRAMKAARMVKFPQKIVKILEEAPRYPEGNGVRLEVKESKDIPAIKQLAKIKLEN